MSVQKLSESAKGVYIIAATPFTDDGALDLQSVDTLTDFYLRCGVHGFTLLGMISAPAWRYSWCTVLTVSGSRRFSSS